MNKEVILTGIRANNDLHIGNYFGALLPMVDMAKKHSEQHEINLFIPDLHSFTTPIDHSKLQQQIMHNLKIFVAAGLPLDNDNIHIYRQSYIPAHSELTWILDCFTGFGEMNKMTEFTDKSRGIYRANADYYNKNLAGKSWDTAEMKIKQEEVFKDIVANVSVGLFNYPVLMASDILLYGAKYIPVGDDQTQHLEYTRKIAERMNKQFGDLFVVPESVAKQHEFFGKDQGLRIKDLVDPTKKMSKSDESARGVIFLGDSPDEAVTKIMGATTDSLNVDNLNDIDPQKQPGLANLLTIFELLSEHNENPTPDIAEGYAYVKRAVAEATKVFLADFQTKLAQVDEEQIRHKLAEDESKMNDVANERLLKVQKAVGLRPA